jgi:RNA polymerase sigma-70 factor (ECF subfamily)
VFDTSRVDDVYQDVLLTFHKARHAFETGRPFAPWLFTVARNAMLDSLARNRKFADREVGMDILPDKGEPDRDLSLDDSLEKALGDLPADQRQAVTLLKLNGYTLQDAAREEGVSVAAMKVRAHRGYEKLRKNLLAVPRPVRKP